MAPAQRALRRFSQPLTITSCTEKLLLNDPSFVELSLERLDEELLIPDNIQQNTNDTTNKSSWSHFCYALSHNFTVRHVCFSGAFVRKLPEQSWHALLEAVGHLQGLQELQIWCSRFPVKVWARTLQQAQALKKVYLFRVTLLIENHDDWQTLASVLSDHPSLTDLRLGGFAIELSERVLQTSNNNAPITVPALCNIDLFIRAMGHAPKLAVVNLQLMMVGHNIQQQNNTDIVIPATPVISGDALLYFLQHTKSLTDLYLSRLGLLPEHLKALATALSEFSQLKLKTLDLFGNAVTNEDVIILAKALQYNTSLETLVLPCPGGSAINPLGSSNNSNSSDTSNSDLSLQSCTALAKALEHNTTLVTLNLPRSNLCDEGLTQLSQGLIVNRTLKKIEVGLHKDVSSKGLQALTKTLEQNYQLERFVVSNVKPSVKETVEYYMRLNEVGRGDLIRNGGTREDWVEMLITVNNDLDCLFYFLSTNPTICQFARHAGIVVTTQEYRTVTTSTPRRHSIHGYTASKVNSIFHNYYVTYRSSTTKVDDADNINDNDNATTNKDGRNIHSLFQPSKKGGRRASAL